MADNTQLNLGTGGDVIATDEIGAAKHQLVKLEFGADGAATMVSAAAPLPVVQTGAHAVTATLAAETTKVIGTVNVAAAQSIAATQSGTWSVRNQDGAGNAITSAARGSERAMSIQVVDGSGNQVTSFGGGAANAVSTANSSTANLAGAAVFTGTSEETTSYSAIQVSVFSSHASATDGLSLQQSSNATNWDIVDVFSVAATTALVIQVPTQARYFRLVYTNGATLTTSLRIQTLFKAVAPRGSCQRPGDALSNENDLETNITYNVGFNGTTWDRLRTVNTGFLGVAPHFAGTAASAGNGASGAQTQRVTIASDSTGVLASVGAITGSVVPGTGATNLGKAEDAAHTSGDVGVQMLAVRNDAGTALAGTTGDYIPLSTDANGSLRVVGSSGTTQYTEDVASAGAESLCLMGAVRRDTAASSSGTDGDYSTLNTDATGNLRVAVSAGGILGVVEDAASAGGEEGILTMTVRSDTLGSTTSANGDFQNLKTNANGALWSMPEGQAAIDAAIAGAPILIGGRASTAAPSAMSADGDAQAFWLTRNGAAVVAGTVVDDAAFGVATERVMPVGFLADETSTDSVDEGDLGAGRMTLDRKQIVTPYAHAAGGYTPFRLVSAASTNATVVKAGPGTIGAITVTSVNAAMRYLRFYNTASAPTVGTTATVYVVPIPGNTAGAGATITFGDAGLSFSAGIAFALTTESTDAGTTGVSANEHVVSIAYI